MPSPRVKKFIQDAIALSEEMPDGNDGEILHEIRKLLDSSIVGATAPQENADSRQEETREKQVEQKEEALSGEEGASPPVFGE